MILLDGNSEIHPREPSDVTKGAAFVGRRKRAGGKARGLQGEERQCRDGLGEVSDGVVVRQEGGVGGTKNEIVTFGDADFAAGIVEEKRLVRVGAFAGVGVLHGGNKELDEKVVSVGRPAKRIHQVAEKSIAARVFLAFEKTAALAAIRFLNPDIVVLEVVEFGFDVVVGGEGEAPVGSEGEAGDFFVDGLERLVEVLGAGGTREEKRCNTEDTEEDAQSPQRRMKGRRKTRTLKPEGCGTHG